MRNAFLLYSLLGLRFGKTLAPDILNTGIAIHDFQHGRISKAIQNVSSKNDDYEKWADFSAMMFIKTGM